jgi:ABC-type glycerol-3-phosphate transport system substrate-binding protein
MIAQNGGDPKSPADKAAADALEYYVNFAKGDNRVWDETMPSSTIAFIGGNLAMYLAPSYRAIEIKNTNPLLKFQVAPVPQLEGGKLAWANYWAVGVSAKSKYQKEAWEFVKYLQEEQTLIKIYSEEAKGPGKYFGAPYPKIALGQKLIDDPIIGAYVKDAPFMVSFPMVSNTYDNGLNDEIIRLFEEAVNQALKGNPGQAVLESVSKNIPSILKRYGAT